MKRGGRRPGAGAPKGNRNALKTGAHSEQVREVLRDLTDEGFFILTKKGGLTFVRKKGR